MTAKRLNPEGPKYLAFGKKTGWGTSLTFSAGFSAQGLLIIGWETVILFWSNVDGIMKRAVLGDEDSIDLTRDSDGNVTVTKVTGSATSAFTAIWV